MARVIDPIVADMQMEYTEAVRSGRWPSAEWIRVCGYGALWRAVCLNSIRCGPRALLNSLAADQWALARMAVYSVVACAALTLLLSAWPMIGTYSRFPNLKLTLLLLPQALPISIPIALSLAIVCGASRMPVRQQRIRRVPRPVE